MLVIIGLHHLGEVIVPGGGGAGQTIEGGRAALTQGEERGLGVVTGGLSTDTGGCQGQAAEHQHQHCHCQLGNRR